MKKAVIFDLDGLLIDSEIISYQLYCDILGKYGYTLTIEEYARTLSGKTAVENTKNVIAAYQLPFTLEEGLTLEAEIEKEYIKKGVALKPGAETLLQYLKDQQIKILLASSSLKERAVGILKENKVDHYFDHMVFGPEVDRGKPFPDIFLKACEKAGESIDDCLVLEDSEAGIAAAHSAGIDVICIPDMKMPGDEFKKMAVCELPSLEDVIGYLKSH